MMYTGMFQIDVDIHAFLGHHLLCGFDFKFNKQIQRIYVPRQDFFLRNKESSEKVKFIRGVTLTRYILFTYVDSNNA